MEWAPILVPTAAMIATPMITRRMNPSGHEMQGIVIALGMTVGTALLLRRWRNRQESTPAPAEGIGARARNWRRY